MFINQVVGKPHVLGMGVCRRETPNRIETLYILYYYNVRFATSSKPLKSLVIRKNVYLCRKNVEHQESKQKHIVIPGNAYELKDLLKPYKKEFKELSLIINGTPYPVISGSKSSDAPQRKKGDIDNYKHENSFGLLKWNKDYEFFIKKMYNDSISFLKKGGYLCIIIKDPVNNKKPFMLQKSIINWILEENKEMKEYGFFIHKHIPETFFMRTYPKMFPEVLIPKYQVAYILKKI